MGVTERKKIIIRNRDRVNVSDPFTPATTEIECSVTEPSFPERLAAKNPV